MIFRYRRGGTDTELDRLIKEARAAELARMDAAFDFDAGLADVYDRAGLTRPSDRNAKQSAPASEDDSESAVRAVCDHIEMIDALLAAVTKSDSGPLLPTSYLKMARQFLLQLRTGLSARRLSAVEAIGLVNSIEHDFREADKTLRRQHGLSLQQALHDRIGELREISTDMTGQTQVLRQNVMRLFDAADDPVPLTPVPLG